MLQRWKMPWWYWPHSSMSVGLYQYIYIYIYIYKYLSCFTSARLSLLLSSKQSILTRDNQKAVDYTMTAPRPASDTPTAASITDMASADKVLDQPSEGSVLGTPRDLEDQDQDQDQDQETLETYPSRPVVAPGISSMTQDWSIGRKIYYTAIPCFLAYLMCVYLWIKHLLLVTVGL